MQNDSIINLVFYTKNIKNNNNNNNNYIFIWEINLEIVSGLDHEIILWLLKSIKNMILNPIIDLPYNFEKAD